MKASKAIQDIQKILNDHGDVRLKVVVQTGPDSFRLVEVVGLLYAAPIGRRINPHIEVTYEI